MIKKERKKRSKRNGRGASPWTKQLVFARDCWQCQYCGKTAQDFKLTRSRKDGGRRRLIMKPLDSKGEVFTVDHIIPWVEGGRNDINNLLTCCYSCNIRKGAERGNILHPYFKIIISTFYEDGKKQQE